MSPRFASGMGSRCGARRARFGVRAQTGLTQPGSLLLLPAFFASLDALMPRCLLPSPFNERQTQVLTGVRVLAKVDEIAQDVGREQLWYDFRLARAQ